MPGPAKITEPLADILSCREDLDTRGAREEAEKFYVATQDRLGPARPFEATSSLKVPYSKAHLVTIGNTHRGRLAFPVPWVSQRAKCN